MDPTTLYGAGAIFALSILQNTAFTMVSRSRNRGNFAYHLVASIGSNSIWFVTLAILVREDMSFAFFLPYVCGTVCGSLFGAKVSAIIERFLGASADGHLAKKDPDPEFVKAVAVLVAKELKDGEVLALQVSRESAGCCTPSPLPHS